MSYEQDHKSRKKTFFLVWVLLCAVMSLSDLHAATLNIRGVQDAAKTNVEKHLQELEQIKRLSQFSNAELQEQILAALKPYGYFRATVIIQSLNASQIDVEINPGPVTLISRLDIQIIGPGAANEIIQNTRVHLPLTSGTPLLTEQYNQAKQNLLNAAESQGYMHANFKTNEISVDIAHNTAEIHLHLDTGPLYYFGPVHFDSNTISPILLQRYVPFSSGNVYSGDQILKLNNNLANSGYFSSVLVKPKIGDAVTVPVEVHLEPVPKYSYSLGAGYGTDTGPRGRAALHIIPVNRDGHKFNALAQGSFVQNALQAQYVIPGSNPIYDQYSITGNYSNLNYSAGYSNAWLLSLAQQHSLRQYKRVLSLNGLYEGFHYTLKPNTEQFLLYPKATFTLSKKEDLLFSPTGYTLTANALAASTTLLSTLNYAQTSLDAKGAYMFEPWRLRLYGHAIQGFTAIKDINQQPLSLALLLGGMDNLKAYSFNSIGPGRMLSYVGFELQKETKKNWYLIGFYDAGGVYDPNPRGFLHDAGAGLMWVSPIGPIKLGVAQALDSHGRRSSSPRLVVSMGPDL